MKKVIMLSLLLCMGGLNVNTTDAAPTAGQVIDGAIGYGNSYFQKTGTIAYTKAGSALQHAGATFPAFARVCQSIWARNLGQTKANLKVWLVDELGVSIKESTIAILATAGFLYGVGAVVLLLKQILGPESRPVTMAESRYLSWLLNGTFRFINSAGYTALGGIWTATNYVFGGAFSWVATTWHNFWDCPECPSCDSTEQLTQLRTCQSDLQAAQSTGSSTCDTTAADALAKMQQCIKSVKDAGYFSINKFTDALSKCVADSGE